MTRGPLALALLLLAGAARAQEPAPRLALPEGREVALGRVLEGASVERRVVLQNAGDAPLAVTHVEPSCGCVVVGPLPGPIAPGGQAELVLRFDSLGRRGPQRLPVWVYTNDLAQADRGRGCTELTLTGEVRSLFRVEPEGAFFGEVVRDPAAPPREARVTISAAPREGRTFAPQLTGPPPEGLQVALEAAGEGRARLVVRLSSDVPPGDLAHDLVLDTGVAEQPRLVVPVVALVSARVAGPRAVELFGVRRASGATRRVPLERRDGRADGVRVLDVASPLPWLRVRAEPVSGARTDLVLEVVPDAPSGAFAAVLDVHLDDRQEPLLRLPVLGEVLPRVQVEPPALLLAPGESAALLVRGGRVREVRAKAAGLAARVEPPLPGQRARARVVVTAAAGWDGAPAVVVLETDVEGEERVSVPVRRAGR